MNKIFSLVLGFFIVSLAVVSATTLQCTDSDNTVNTASDPSYLVFGHAHRIFTIFDYCANGPGTDTLREAYCNGNSVAYMPVSCSSAFGTDYKCFFGTCTKLVWCGFETQSPAICDRLSGDMKDKCIEVLNDNECKKQIPESVCTWIGGTSYDTQDHCNGYNDSNVPEFSAVAAGIALTGAGAGFMLLRKRR